MKSIFKTLLISSIIFICGCSIDGGCSVKSQISQKSADYIVLSQIIDEFNKNQTNWTVIITARTNN